MTFFLPAQIEQLKEKLIQGGTITKEMMAKLAAESAEKHTDLLDLLVQENVITKEYANDFINTTLGVVRAELDASKIDEATIRKLPEAIARERQVVVFKIEENGTADVAMANPSDLASINFLSQYLSAPIKSFLASSSDLNLGFSVYGRGFAQDFKKIIDEKIEASLRSRSNSVQEAAAQLPIVEVVDNLLSYALTLRTSDVHLEIMEKATLVRYRIDGILRDIMSLNKAVHPALVARLKLLSGLKLDEHSKPQDGRFRYNLGTRPIDIRVSVIPTYHGEKVEMRLLEGTERPLTFEELGMAEDMRRVLNENLSKAYGMVLVTGPTGAGKTTTLYSFLNILNKPEVNVTSVEDPIEYNIARVNQIQINPQAGITFASGLRAILRQDPNVVMVGEIRDGETANIAVQAALTGHLIISSLHTNDAPTAIPRLVDLGVPAFLLASVLNLVIAQRLVRRLCPVCVYSNPITDEVAKVIADQLSTKDLKDKRIPHVLYRGKGCDTCGQSGYKGRLGIYEFIEIKGKIKEEISNPGFNLERLRTLAAESGARTMFEDGLEKVQLAVTTIEEVLRVIRE
ncbi:MAG: GspE/PulE family protein [Patescibacteria group bacterium]